ncbi:cytochrome c peroxidase [Runella defluvii]|uniref:Cytochrome c peroxidase n=1 Tax=Runella defluvii TaxID=370973 RepID=A0A7W5ZTF4_9BACT|nr:cytochrome c peroxidase [Runella defluvii]MBB3841429.1 cytochrome c peroxidase [Runella defluvii]
MSFAINTFRINYLKIAPSLLLGLTLGMGACQPTEDIDPTANDGVSELMKTPTHFPVLPDVPYNRQTVEGVRLGRKLFFETSLSGNNQISCATCHLQEKAFTDGVALTTKGQSGAALSRNTPGLTNLAWATNGLFWDGGATNLESLSIGPITHLDEMAQNILELPSELGAKENYIQLFEAAFPDEKATGITTPKVLKALAQYMRTLNSGDAQYDRFVQKNVQLTEVEQRGMNIFDAKCATCHQRTQHLFTDNVFHNNGLDSEFTDIAHERAAQGRFRITFKTEDLGKYKTPTLRNLSFTAPYMHDGRFKTLEEVLEHYSSGIKNSPSLDNNLRNFTLSNQEKSDLLSFLKTLDDENFTKNKNFKPL